MRPIAPRRTHEHSTWLVIHTAGFNLRLAHAAAERHRHPARACTVAGRYRALPVHGTAPGPPIDRQDDDASDHSMIGALLHRPNHRTLRRRPNERHAI
jgi:hypothetical protein